MLQVDSITSAGRTVGLAAVGLGTLLNEAVHALQATAAGSDLDLLRILVEGSIVGGIGVFLVLVSVRLIRLFLSANERLVQQLLELAQANSIDDSKDSSGTGGQNDE